MAGPDIGTPAISDGPGMFEFLIGQIPKVNADVIRGGDESAVGTDAEGTNADLLVGIVPKLHAQMLDPLIPEVPFDAALE